MNVCGCTLYIRSADTLCVILFVIQNINYSIQFQQRQPESINEFNEIIIQLIIGFDYYRCLTE